MEGLCENSYDRRNTSDHSWNRRFVAGGVSFTHEEKDVDIGPVQLSHKQTKTVPISPILSTISLIAAVGLVVVAVRKVTTFV